MEEKTFYQKVVGIKYLNLERIFQVGKAVLKI